MEISHRGGVKGIIEVVQGEDAYLKGSTISSNTRRMSLALLALIWREPFLALTLTTLQHFRQLMTQKLYTHVDGRPRKVRTALRGEPFLMYETRLSRMIMQLPPAQMANRDGECWDGDYAMGYQHHP